MTRPRKDDALFVTRLRQPVLTHAFERALEDARFHEASLAAGENEETQSEEAAQRFKSALDSLPELSGAARYVAARSLDAAYKAEAEQARKTEQVRKADAEQTRKPETVREAMRESVRMHRAARAERPQPVRRPQPIKLEPGLGVRDLKRLRRQYALANHPDRVAAELREDAARFMAEANAAIDKALKQASRG